MEYRTSWWESVFDTSHPLPLKCIESSRMLLLQEAALRQWGIQEADERFRVYAKECVEEWAARGRNTMPMELYLAAASRKPALHAS